MYEVPFPYFVLTMVELSYKVWVRGVLHKVKLGLLTVVGDFGGS